jgi:hypothetical protein
MDDKNQNYNVNVHCNADIATPTVANLAMTGIRRDASREMRPASAAKHLAVINATLKRIEKHLLIFPYEKIFEI